jgi:phosphoglycerate dehydrogenase-like enzyme
MDRPVVVVVGAPADDPPPGLDAAQPLAELRTAWNADALAGAIADADALFAWGARRAWLEAVFDRGERLRWIQSASDGVDGLLFPALIESDVEVTNARGVFDDAIAEWAIAAFCAFATGLHRSITDTIAGRWVGDRARRRVAGSTLCVIGPGPIGRAAARRARDLGMRVTAVGRSAREDELLGTVHDPSEISVALADADFVLDALPLAPGTERFVDAEVVAAMKEGAIFANVGRGRTVDQAALVDALRAGHLGGAALDVFEEEPLPPDSPLWTLPNAIVSPHVCGDVAGWEEEVVGVFVDNLGRFVRGEPLRNRVDKAAGFGT